MRKLSRATYRKLKLKPYKYYAGLTRKQALARQREIKKFGSMNWRDPKAYVGFKTNRAVDRNKTRKSSYTAQWDRLFPGVKSLEDRAAVTGVPLWAIKESFRRGSAAWRSGHRPGQTPQSWSYPRVSSLLLCGKTHYTADSDLVRKAKAESASARKWWSRCSAKPKRASWNISR
jgi:hypothetical protein